MEKPATMAFPPAWFWMMAWMWRAKASRGGLIGGSGRRAAEAEEIGGEDGVAEVAEVISLSIAATWRRRGGSRE